MRGERLLSCVLRCESWNRHRATQRGRRAATSHGGGTARARGDSSHHVSQPAVRQRQWAIEVPTHAHAIVSLWRRIHDCTCIDYRVLQDQQRDASRPARWCSAAKPTPAVRTQQKIGADRRYTCAIYYSRIHRSRPRVHTICSNTRNKQVRSGRTRGFTGFVVCSYEIGNG